MSNDNNELLDRIIEKYSNKKNLPVKNHSICVKTNNCAYDIIRLDDDQYHILINSAIPISEDYSQLMSLYKNDKLIYSSFSKMYTALSMLFGENGKYFDGWKGSFSFPLLIHFHHNGQEFEYLMNIHNIRSSIEFGLGKLITPNDNVYEKNAIHEPFDEFPREEILYFINYFIGFLTGFFQNNNTKYNEFYMTVESNLILFGYKKGLFFDDQYESEDEFNEALEELKKTTKG